MFIETKTLASNIKNIIDNNLGTILNHRNQIKLKEDKSYVTKGDILINQLLKKYLLSIFTDFIYISEEDYKIESNWDLDKSYIFVDPIDGTENFVSGLKEWGTGISIYYKGNHYFSLIYLPELNEIHFSKAKIKKFNSRIAGLSSSISSNDLINYPVKNEIRITGCAMYNLYNVARGSFKYFENIKGVNCWDILPGLNLCLESGCKIFVDEILYQGEILFPNKKYKIRLTSG